MNGWIDRFCVWAIVATLALTSGFAAAAPLVESLGCGACHLGFADASDAISATPGLAGVGERFSAEQLIVYLMDPPVGRKPTRMPDYGFNREEAAAITAHLLQEDSEKAARGAALYTAQRCVACHTGRIVPLVAAPFINFERHRVNDPWLQAFLAEPEPIRPLGHPAGSGGRMPDFRLSAAEVAEVFAVFSPPPEAVTAAVGEALSPYGMNKAQRLMSEKLSCLGCHRLGSEGGRVGPDLSSLSARLRPAYVAAIIRDPQASAPGTIMPRHRLAPRYTELLINYLNQQQLPVSPPAVVQTWSPLPADMSSLYGKYCAVCHGSSGGGDGPNATYLRPAPAALSDAAVMARRPDDTLFDGIYAGGRILDRSHRMPAWGQTFSSEQIAGLVDYVRDLCDCAGPLWSRDHKRQDAQ